MVLSAYSYCSYFTWCIACGWRRFGCSSFYLYLILMSSKTDNTKSILVIAIGFLLLSILFAKYNIASKILLAFAIFPGLVHLISPKAGGHIVAVWNKISDAMGFVSSRIILSIVYYLLLFPISIFYRLSNKNHLQRKKSPHSIFKERNHQYTKKDLENIW